MLARVFVLKIRKNEKSTDNTLRIKSKIFDSTSILFKKIPRRVDIDFTDPVISSLEKEVLLEGTVTKLHGRIEYIVALLIECDKCGSIFYFILDKLNHMLPFLCNKANCNSRQFFSHFSRVLTNKIRKVKLGAILINYRKLINNQSMDLEIHGSNKIALSKGLDILCKAIVKILPISKNNQIGLTERNLFVVYSQTWNYKLSLSGSIKYKNVYFLSKNDFSFISQLYSCNDIFHILIKNIQPFHSRNDGLKACLLLLITQQFNKLKKTGNNKKSVYTCLVLSNNSVGDKCFIPEIVRSFPRSFFFNYENFKFMFIKNGTHNQFTETGKYIKFKNSIILIDFNPKCNRITKIKNLIIKIKKNLKKVNYILFHCILIFLIKIDKKYTKEKLENPDFCKDFNFSFTAKKTLTLRTEESTASQLVNYQLYNTNSHPRIITSVVNKNLTRISIYDVMFFKKKLSGHFCKKFMNFLQNFPDAFLSNSSVDLILQIYKKIKIIKNSFLTSSIDFIITLLNLSQCRAKIDFREQICIDDVFDGMEIYFDSTPRCLIKLLNNLNLRATKTQRKLKFINKFLSLLHKFFYRTGQTLFDLNGLETIFPNEIKFSEIIEVLENFKIIKKLRKQLFFLII